MTGTGSDWVGIVMSTGMISATKSTKTTYLSCSLRTGQRPECSKTLISKYYSVQLICMTVLLEYFWCSTLRLRHRCLAQFPSDASV